MHHSCCVVTAAAAATWCEEAEVLRPVPWLLLRPLVVNHYQVVPTHLLQVKAETVVFSPSPAAAAAGLPPPSGPSQVAPLYKNDLIVIMFQTTLMITEISQYLSVNPMDVGLIDN